jgi:hypothetical protein
MVPRWKCESKGKSALPKKGQPCVSDWLNAQVYIHLNARKCFTSAPRTFHTVRSEREKKYTVLAETSTIRE